MSEFTTFYPGLHVLTSGKELNKCLVFENNVGRRKAPVIE